jgi:hypothetical protein
LPLVISLGQDRQSRTAQNFFNKNKNFEVQNANVHNYINNSPHKGKNSPNEIIEFKVIGSSQMLNNAPPTNTYGHMGRPGGGYHIDNNEMLYKILKGDTKLVRSLCEANNFNFTESHEWNILWASSSCKAYLYEGLNEF